MESNFTNNSNSDKNDARMEVVAQLEKDRQQIAQHQLLPTWFHPALGVVAVTYVVAPALPNNGGSSSGFMFALVSTLILIYIAQRTTGIKASHGSLKAQLILVGMLIVLLAGLIVTLGLVSFNLNWWAVVPALIVFIMVQALSKLYEKSLRSLIVRGH